MTECEIEIAYNEARLSELEDNIIRYCDGMGFSLDETQRYLYEHPARQSMMKLMVDAAMRNTTHNFIVDHKTYGRLNDGTTN